MKKKAMSAGKVICLILVVFVGWQALASVLSIDTSNDYRHVSIQRPDIGYSGSTTYFSFKPWKSYHEEVTVFRFFTTSIAVRVDETKKVTSIQYMPNFYQFQKPRVLYLREDGTVTVHYYDDGYKIKGQAYEEYREDFELAEELLKETRIRYAHLIPPKFKKALNID